VQGLSSVIGQARAIERLRSALRRGRLHHAYLFDGPEGVGKRTAALALAQALCCEAAPGEGCGRCAPCRKIADGVHPDVVAFRVFDDEGKIKGQTDRMRDLIGAVGYPPHEASVRLVLIDPADELIREAANAFLKTLEEPPPRNHFVLVASAPARLPSTIRSRCERIAFAPLPAALVAERLVAEHGADPQAAATAAALSGGSLARAAEVVSAGDLAARRDRAARLLAAAHAGRPGAIVEAAGDLSGNRDEASAVLDLLWLTYHDAVVASAGGTAGGEADGAAARLAARVAPRALLRGIESVQEAADAVRGYVSPQLAIERLLLGLHQVGSA
jgi:DNA polymerase III subunit delta'